MKASAQQHRETFRVLSVHTNSESNPQSDIKTRFFFGRRKLHSVDATSDQVTKRSRIFNLPQLTSYDVMRVNHATIREGESHRIWPPNVLRQFNEAKVVTTSRIKHYELKDANLNRVYP